MQRASSQKFLLSGKQLALADMHLLKRSDLLRQLKPWLAELACRVAAALLQLQPLGTRLCAPSPTAVLCRRWSLTMLSWQIKWPAAL